MHGHHLTHIDDPGSARIPGGLSIVFLVLAVIGTLGFVGLGLAGGDEAIVQKAWMGFTVSYVFFFFLSMGAAAFLAINYVVGAKWHIVLKRPFEAIASFSYRGGFILPIIGALFGSKHLYSWWADDRTYPYAQTLKGVWLSPGLHVAKVTIYSVVLAAITYVLVSNSTKADKARTPDLAAKQCRFSIAFLLVFGPVFSLFGLDVIKSLEPKWFSTMWGVYCFAGALVSSLALTMLLAFWMKGRSEHIHERQLYDLGTYVMGFATFMMYIGFSQFMLIWYANLPDETFYYTERYAGGWAWLTISLPILKWVIPFLVLMPPTWRTSRIAQGFVCVCVLAGQLADVYWMIAPVFPLGVPTPLRAAYLPNPANVLSFIAVLGFFGWNLTSFLNSNSILPVGDPNLVNSANGEYLHA